MAKVEITINGQKIQAEAGQTVLQAAEAAGISVPKLCYHPALSSWGACRICLVEIEKQRTLQPACTFPVSEGMVVQTESPACVESRKFVLELLFSERNHYCMYCQASGDCELQALAYQYGLDSWKYPRPYEPLPVDASREYFVLDHNRCILCRRCVRACAEIAANHTLGVRERGAKSMISADLQAPFGESTCVTCGTCIQVCPTGSLIDRKSAYMGRDKEVDSMHTTCFACSLGCAVNVVSRANHLLRIESVWDVEPSYGLLCVAGRFEPLYDGRPRLKTPLVKKDGQQVAVSWDEALDAAAAGLKQAGDVGALVTPRATNETLVAVTKAFQNAALTHAAPLPDLPADAALADVEQADLVVLVGADVMEDHRVVSGYIKRALDHGARLAVIGGEDNGLAEYATLVSPEARRAVNLALEAAQPIVVYGAGTTPESADLLKVLVGQAKFLPLVVGANAVGAANLGLNGQFRSAPGLYVLLGDDRANGRVAEAAAAADFLVVQASYASPLTERADVVLPAPIWAEQSGHLTNLENKTHRVAATIHAPAGVTANTVTLQALAQRLG
ncbi:MAG: (2Fe-2S)-binding protein [Chloroflexi bacterium]|nr:(2Fe-2S)-binding protein [Chloroflexota bacterium]